MLKTDRESDLKFSQGKLVKS